MKTGVTKFSQFHWARREVWVEEEVLKCCWQHHTVEKNPPEVGGKMCVAWFGLVGSGILRFLKSSGVQACLQIFRGSL